MDSAVCETEFKEEWSSWAFHKGSQLIYSFLDSSIVPGETSFCHYVHLHHTFLLCLLFFNIKLRCRIKDMKKSRIEHRALISFVSLESPIGTDRYRCPANIILLLFLCRVKYCAQNILCTGSPSPLLYEDRLR